MASRTRIASRLLVAHGIRQRIATWCEGLYPEEACGLLVGRREGDLAEVVRAVWARNLESERAGERFEVDPEAYISADRQAQADGLEIIGVWHSHPDQPAKPSEWDRRAAWHGWSYVIVSITEAGVAETRSWKLEGTRFVEEVLFP